MTTVAPSYLASCVGKRSADHLSSDLKPLVAEKIRKGEFKVAEEIIQSSSRSVETPASRTKKRRRTTKRPPTQVRRSWTVAEDQALEFGVQNFPGDWKAIAQCVVTRNHTQCLQRWQKVLKPGIKKGAWSAAEDKILRDLTVPLIKLQDEKNERVDWTIVAEKISNRTAKQCRERWVNHLDPTINKDPWTSEEEELLLKLGQQYPNKWAKIARFLPGRRENMVKIRFKALMREVKKKVEVKKSATDDLSTSSGSSTGEVGEGMSYQDSLVEDETLMESYGVFDDIPKLTEPFTLYPQIPLQRSTTTAGDSLFLNSSFTEAPYMTPDVVSYLHEIEQDFATPEFAQLSVF